MPRVVQFAVLVVDDEDGLRQPLTRQLGQVEGLRVCGAVGTGDVVLTVAAVERPAVVGLDWHGPGMEPVALIGQLRLVLPQVRVVVSSSDATAARDALRAGADSFG
ncbi:MAG: two-component system, NarL family, nitrate/nitrite response regulator NarL, partial [Pseudonocardiales bacterium]|nr:two-component system, NarL family, nitrate/nitrite response regulator NarL [Pseudonocardiales bacterium]